MRMKIIGTLLFLFAVIVKRAGAVSVPLNIGPTTKYSYSGTLLSMCRCQHLPHGHLLPLRPLHGEPPALLHPLPASHERQQL